MKKLITFFMIFCILVPLSACANAQVDTQTTSERYVLGDADGDGVLSIRDATTIQKHLAALITIPAESLKQAMVRNGKKLNIRDATLIQKKLVGLIKKFPVEEQEQTASDKDTLVVYFSCTGHTEPIAGYAADYLDADIFEIEAAVPYTDEDIAYYTDCRADKEQSDPMARPKIANSVENISQYKTILLGYPIWHGQAPKIIYTFLESYDFSGKKIVPFCTSGSSGIGSSATNLHSLAPNAEWKDGRRFAIGTDEATVKEWIDELGIKTADTESKELQMTINGEQVDVDWEDNESVATLKEAVKTNPMTIEMSMYGGFEQVGSLGMSLPRNDTRITTEAGDVVLYSGNQMVVFYGSNTWEYTMLGKIKNQNEDQLRELLSNGNATIIISIGSE